MDALGQALTLQANSADARYAFAWVLGKRGYYQDAANELGKLLSAHPREVRARLLLGNIYADDLGQPKLARDQYVKALDLIEPQSSQAAVIWSGSTSTHDGEISTFHKNAVSSTAGKLLPSPSIMCMAALPALSRISYGYFDGVVIAGLLIGIFRGRKRGMTQELLPTLEWLAIVAWPGCFIFLSASSFSKTPASPLIISGRTLPPMF